MRQADRKKAIAKAKAILKGYKGQRLPIKVDVIAKDLGATITAENFEDDTSVSAMLYREGKKKIIGINTTQSIVRQRFSIAHEIGHLVLHEGNLYVDRSVKVNFRDSRSSMAVDPEEIEANAFAAELLMPEEIVNAETKRHMRSNPKSSAEELISNLATKFKVSEKAMDFRLQNLHIIVSIAEGSDG